MKTAHYVGAALLLLASCASGCRLLSADHPMLHGQSPLKPAPSSPDSVTMEIIWARFPANDPVLDDASWRSIDETQIDPAVRRELVNNGIRAGVVSGSVPPAIDKVLHQGPPADAPTVESVTGSNASSAKKSQTAELLTEPIIHGRTRRLRRNEKFEIQASEPYPSMLLLQPINNGTELTGHIFEQADAIYSLRVDPRPDRTVTVELTPEINHGTPRLRYTGGDDGVLRQASLKEREVFDRLRMSVKLAPGEMLVLMSMPEAGSLLGHYFHTVDTADGPQQKLILIRLAEVPQNDAFADTGKP
ncbi:MAG TPA: hypothetical protein VH107_00610 [Lacipirellulaceae bacterium]|jgi:hypothetical protein|nr:hypothetical protein [Lacipirellulaceae bacterium]